MLYEKQWLAFPAVLKARTSLRRTIISVRSCASRTFAATECCWQLLPDSYLAHTIIPCATDLCNERCQLISAEQLVYAHELRLKWRCKDALAAKNLSFVHPELAIHAPALLSHTTLHALDDIVSEGVDSDTQILSDINKFEQQLEDLLRSKEFAEACAPSEIETPRT
jgi:hypothetical protein